MRLHPASCFPALAVILASVICAATCSLDTAADATDNNDDGGFGRLAAWMINHGGRVADTHIGLAVMNNGIRGVVALDTLEDGAELLFCPWTLIIGSTGLDATMGSSGSTAGGGTDMCGVVQAMADEIRRGENSLWYPYLDNIELPESLPATWAASTVDELQGLPPSYDRSRHIQWFQQTCAQGSEQGDGEHELDAATMRSLVSFISRASAVGMIPIYDLLNHHNGKRNAKLVTTKEGVSLTVVGGRIERGAEVFLSYGLKVASTMLRDYGFVEDWPTCWNFREGGDNYAFVAFPDGVAAVNPTGEYLQHIGRANGLSLEEYQRGAELHTRSVGVEELRRFARAAHSHLEGFPTSASDDQAILTEKREILGRIVEDESSLNGDAAAATTTTMEHDISAIEYRRAFKSALETAVVSSEMAIKGASLGHVEL